MTVSDNQSEVLKEVKKHFTDNQLNTWRSRFGNLSKIIKNLPTTDCSKTVIKNLWKNYSHLESSDKSAAKALIDYVCEYFSLNVEDIYNTRTAPKSKYQSKVAAKNKKSNNVPQFKTSAFLKDWKKIKYVAYVVYGNRCSCCGATAKDTKLSVDHIIPKSKDPSKALDIRNLQILCEDCNSTKADDDSIDWRTMKQRFDALTCYHYPQSIKTFKRERENV